MCGVALIKNFFIFKVEKLTDFRNAVKLRFCCSVFIMSNRRSVNFKLIGKLLLGELFGFSGSLESFGKRHGKILRKIKKCAAEAAHIKIHGLLAATQIEHTKPACLIKPVFLSKYQAGVAKIYSIYVAVDIISYSLIFFKLTIVMK